MNFQVQVVVRLWVMRTLCQEMFTIYDLYLFIDVFLNYYRMKAGPQIREQIISILGNTGSNPGRIDLTKRWQSPNINANMCQQWYLHVYTDQFVITMTVPCNLQKYANLQEIETNLLGDKMHSMCCIWWAM